MAGVRKRVGDQPERRLRRIDVGTSGDVLLEYVVLYRPGELCGVHTLVLADQLVKQEQHGGGCVDRHRGGHLAQRDAIEQHAHVIDRVDRHTYLADLALSHVCV